MSAYAYFVQNCREEHKKLHPEENVVFSEFSKKCADKWKTMDDEDKEDFHDKAQTDKARFTKEMANYDGPLPTRGGKKTKQKKDPNAPKRSLSAFFWFSGDQRAKVRKENPDAGIGEIAKELGLRWRNIDPQEKERYNDMAAKDKERYAQDMKAFKAGTFGKKPKVAESESDENEDDDDDEEMESDE